jgi:hypothetical protein
MSAFQRFAAVGLLGLAACGLSAHAQAVYRIVGPDGRVTFSDRLPADAGNRPAAGGATGTAAAPAGAALPFELRNVANRYPVTLYTGANCAPCGSGRNYLVGRGVPHTERTVTSAEDIEALQRISGGGSLPFLTIGGQQLRGFSEVEWSQFLDAAGYPRSSQLPGGYRNPAPSPLVAVQRPPAAGEAAAPAPQQAEAPAPAPLAPPPPNPAGIRF